MRQEEEQLNKWSYEYYRERETSASGDSNYDNFYRRNISIQDYSEDEVEKDKMATIRDDILRQELRLRDIRDSYKMMDGPSDILDRLQARGTCTVGDPPEPEAVKEVEEDEDKEFLFDPKELDL